MEGCIAGAAGQHSGGWRYNDSLAVAASRHHVQAMYSRSSEPVRFERDCAVVLVPQGENVTLPAGSAGYITQALGGSYTVFVEGNLFRLAGRDADAIGKEPPEDRSVNCVEGEVWDIGYLGDVSIYHVRLASGTVLRCTQANRLRLIERAITWEDRVWLSWTPDASVILKA